MARQFEVGDEVWYLAGTRVRMGIVGQVIESQLGGKTYYRIQDGTYPEDVLYPTMEELLKNISWYR